MTQARARTLAIAALVLSLGVTATAQTTIYYPDNNTAPNPVATPGGWYPLFTNVTGIRYQIRIPASAFVGVTPGAVISALGFFVGSTNLGTPPTYTVLQYRLAQAAGTALTNNFTNNFVAGTDQLVFDAPNSTYPLNPAGNAWRDFTFTTPYVWTGSDLILDARSQIPTGGSYFQQSVASNVPRLISTAYTGQATGTLGTSSGAKVRFQILSGGTDYQVNQPGASLDFGGLLGTASLPAITNLALNQPTTLNVNSTQTGAPWEIALGSLPLVTPATGGTILAGGQILNLSLAHPSFGFLFGFFQSPPFSSAGFPFSSSVALSLSGQMAVIDPAQSAGVSLSQPVRIVVQ